MRKFRGVIDGIRSTVGAGGGSNAGSPKIDAPAAGVIEETLCSEQFQTAKVARHGFPYQPTALAYDVVQNLLAIGTKFGSIRLFGRPGVECHMQHEVECSVIQIMFLVNEGALVSVCANDQLHLWSFRQKKPEIVHSLKFQRERITYCHLPFQSKWLYIGTERGNVHIVNLESFALSGYVINWNRAIELLSKAHPGPVVHLSDNQMDPNMLLIGFESGLLALWDLKNKTAEFRYNCTKSLRSACWHHEGKQFLCSHGDGSLTTWNVKSPQRYQSCVIPHAKICKDGQPDLCRQIMKAEIKSNRNSEPFIIFSGGLPFDRKKFTPSITVKQGSNMTVIEMDQPVIDFITICSTPWSNDFQDPYAVAVLLENELVIIDLLSPKYPCFENPYPMDLAESPVTACTYLADCPTDLTWAFYSVGCKQKKSGYSEKDWPVKGGDCSASVCSYPEIVITGHADGSLKFWDASAVTVQVLYKLKTAKLFDETKCQSPDASDFPFAIQLMHFCLESRMLCVAGLSHVLLFKYNKQEMAVHCPVIEVNIMYEICDGPDSPEVDYSPRQTCDQKYTLSSNGKEYQTCVKVKSGSRKWLSGYQPLICCILTWIDDAEPPPSITSISLNSKYGLLAFGNECGVAIVDFIQKTCILSMGTPDLYGSMDPYTRAPRSPKQKSRPQGSDNYPTPEDSKNSSTDQKVLSSPAEKSFRTDLASIIENIDQDEGCFLVEDPSNESKCLPQDVPKFDCVVFQPTLEGDAAITCKELEEEEPTHHPHQPTHHPHQPTHHPHQQCDIPIAHLPLIDQCDNSTTNLAPVQDVRRHSVSPDGRILAKLTSKLHLKMSPWHHADKTTDPLPVDNKDSTHRRFSQGNNFLHQIQKSLKGPTTPIPSDSQPDSSTNPVGSQSGDNAKNSDSKFQKMKQNLKNASKCYKESSSLSQDSGDLSMSSPRRKSCEFEMIDISSDDLLASPCVYKITYTDYLLFDKSDSSQTFSPQSHSSSLSSLDNVNKEAIQCLTFSDAFTHRSDNLKCPSLWAGTSLGSVLAISINIPSNSDSRKVEPVVASPSGTIFRLKGAILSISFLNSNEIPFSSLANTWKDLNSDEPARDKRPYYRQQSMSNLKMRMSPSSNDLPYDQQYAIVCSEKQARTIALPSQTCVYKVKITETSSVAKAEIISMKGAMCLACFLLNGHIMTISLPSLRPMLDVDHVPFPSVRMSRTICFSNNCSVLYFCSPSEIQKVTLSAEVCENLNEMLCDLFLPCDMPEAPKVGFFQSLFNVGTSTLDREELFGEGSGKASKGVAKYTGMAGAQDAANLANSEIGRAKMAAIERGEKLGELEERTERLKTDAELYAQTAHQLKMKYKDKKWYQF